MRPVNDGRVYLSREFDGREPPAGDRSRNGAYRGALPVRQLAPGISGKDLRARREPLAHGQLWTRGPQLVRIVQVTARHVSFRELSFGKALRRLARGLFLRTSLRKARG